MKLQRFPSVRHDKMLSLEEFWGYNHTPACTSCEFSEMENLSSRNFPALSPISRMVKLEEGLADLYVYDQDVLRISTSGELYIGGEKLAEGLAAADREYSVLGKYLVTRRRPTPIPYIQTVK